MSEATMVSITGFQIVTSFFQAIIVVYWIPIPEKQSLL